MPDNRDERETRRLLERQFKRWVYMVTHYGWKVDILYHKCAEDMPAGGDCQALTIAHFQYLDAVVHVNLRRCNDLSEKEIEYVVVHELTHLLVSPLRESQDEIPLEYTVTSLARIMMGLRV